MSSERFEFAVTRLKNLRARDDAKIAIAQAKNSVESFLFETRDKLTDEEGEMFMTEEEREKLETTLSEVSEWLDDEGWDTTEEVYNLKLNVLKDASKDFYLRISENKNRPEALENLRRSMNLTATFLSQIAGMKEREDMFTNKDLEDVSKVLNETIEWLYVTEKKQNESKSSDNPVLLVKDITLKTGKLDRELMYLLNKAKYYVPKAKPSDNSTSTNSTEPKIPKKSDDKIKESDKTDESKEGKSNRQEPGDNVEKSESANGNKDDSSDEMKGEKIIQANDEADSDSKREKEDTIAFKKDDKDNMKEKLADTPTDDTTESSKSGSSEDHKEL